MTTPVAAELQRRNASGTLVAWTVNDDGTDPVSDAGTHTTLASILAKLGTGIALDTATLAALESITVTVANFPATQPVSGTVAVTNASLANLDLATTALRDALRGSSSKTLTDLATALAAITTALTDGSARTGGTVAVTGPLTLAQLAATTLHVDDNGGSLTTDGSFDRRFSPSSTRLTRASTVAATGLTVLVATTSAQKIRLYWVGLSTSQDNGAEVGVQIKIGTNVIYDWNLGNPGAFSHFEVIDGALDEDLTITTTNSQPIKVNLTYEVI